MSAVQAFDYRTEGEREADRWLEQPWLRQEVAYIHPQGIAPDGLFFDGRKVERLIRDGVISQCDDCGSEDPNDPAYMIVGDDDESEANLAIVLRYEVPAP